MLLVRLSETIIIAIGLKDSFGRVWPTSVSCWHCRKHHRAYEFWRDNALVCQKNAADGLLHIEPKGCRQAGCFLWPIKDLSEMKRTVRHFFLPLSQCMIALQSGHITRYPLPEPEKPAPEPEKPEPAVPEV
jgi:hypothetical protein